MESLIIVAAATIAGVIIIWFIRWYNTKRFYKRVDRNALYRQLDTLYKTKAALYKAGAPRYELIEIEDKIQALEHKIKEIED